MKEMKDNEDTSHIPVLVLTAIEKEESIAECMKRGAGSYLIKTDYSLEVIDIEEYTGTKNHLQRVRGRLIGTEGKARKTIEALTECYVSIYGRTVAIIGNVENVALARKAVEGLLKGSKHGNIYKWLEKRRKEIIQKEFEQRG